MPGSAAATYTGATATTRYETLSSPNDYCGTYDAQLIFDEFEPHELDIEPMFFEHAFFCRTCGQMATPKTYPHTADDHVFLSGRRVRELLSEGKLPPAEFSRPEVAEILISAYRES